MHSGVILFLIAGLLGQQPVPREMPKLVSIGKITKFEPATKSFELTSENRDSSRRPQEPAVFSAEAQIGINVGRDAKRQPAADPREPSYDPFDHPEDSNAPRPSIQVFKTKVFLVETTTCTSGNKPVSCDELKLGDSVRVTGDERRTARGKGMYATQIARLEMKR